MKFSIVIPCYNEKEDVRLAIESALAQDWTEKEIIVVDDSSDATREIVDGYVDRGVRVIRPEVRRGCCEARNLGWKAATGEVIVFLNADVHPRPDFLAHLRRHYEKGADLVVLRSVTSNEENCSARFIQSQAEGMYADRPDSLTWSEGFSCRRDAIASVGGIPGDFPLPFCRDWLLGRLLEERGYRKVVDLGYEISHRAPNTLGAFYKQKRRDGRFSVLFFHFLNGWSVSALGARILAKQVSLAAVGATLLPLCWVAWRAAKASSRGVRDWIPFMLCEVTYRISYSVGEWVGIRRLSQRDHPTRRKQ